MNRLPIDDILPEIVATLSSTRSIVLKAEPGAGKTTRVPPAILDAGLATLNGGRPGQIVVLQPRRIAARSAALRIADERSTAIGTEVGFSVRHETQASSATRILICTTGVFLRMLQDDPSIDRVAVVIFDEFHERTVDGDLALALTHQVQQSIRPDMHIVVMSATLDMTTVSQYLNNCPALECPGKTFPVEIEFLQFPASDPLPRLVEEGVSKIVSRTHGSVLVFLPGVAEIRQCESRLLPLAEKLDLALMCLYGEMPLSEQQAVLQPLPKRKVVLATNVAETSLTIDGVTAVLDSGLARINRLDPSLGINKLELSRISRAAAAQRAGRAGRTAPGLCLRLWSKREDISLPEFELPEIERLDLSACILQLKAWGEKDLASFPWFESPPDAAIEQALRLLDELGATVAGKLTDLGRKMARLPLQPRLARLLLEGQALGQPRRAALCAALLSERAPFRNQDKSVGLSHHTQSDVLEEVRAIENYEGNKIGYSIMGEIIPGTVKQILRTRKQLLELTSEPDGKDDITNATISPDKALLRAIMTAFPDRICKRRRIRDQRAVMVGGRGVKLSEQSTVANEPLFVAVDIIDLNRPDLSVRRASAIDRDWLPDLLINSSVEVKYDPDRQKVVAFKRTFFIDLILDESVATIPAGIDPGAILAEAIATSFDITSLVDETALTYLARINFLREYLPELNLPNFGSNPWRRFLPEWCCGCTSVTELRERSLVDAVQANLTAEQTVSIERDAPEFISIPNGRRVKLKYEEGKLPILSARIQELFGLGHTPRLARSRVPVMMHLLAPNNRVQQITDDMENFWKQTYRGIRKELKGRYPKHAWPEDPLKI